MPLSENEQRQLEAIERALLADDPKFAATVRSSDLRRYYRRKVVRSAVLFLIGLALLACTFIRVYLGIAGFLIMFAGALGGMAAYKRMHSPADTRFGHNVTPIKAKQSRDRRGGWKNRAEERFKRRFDDRG